MVLVIAALGALAINANAQKPSNQRKSRANETLNLFEKHKADYAASDKPTIVEIGDAKYLTIAGKGGPGDPEFQKKMGVLYAVAYGLKTRSKYAGKDYLVSPVEGLWWGAKGDYDFFEKPRESWNWKLIIRTPDFITDHELASAVSRSGGPPATNEVKLETIGEGKCVHIMHTGSYDEEAPTIAQMHDFAKSKGLRLHGPHHEIYLTAPNQTAPEKMKTILRQPVK